MSNLSLGELGLDCWPCLTLSGITEQVHDDGSLGDGLINLEEGLAWHPAVLLSVLPRLTVLSDTDDDVETLITHVQGLGVSLRTVSNDGHCVILEVFLFPQNQYIAPLCVQLSVKDLPGALRQASRHALFQQR